MTNVFQKDPSGVLDYKFDWKARTNTGSLDPNITNWLNDGEIIESYVITSASGISVSGSFLTDSSTSVTVWLADGDAFNDYSVACKITTSSSPIARVDERTITIQVRNR